MIGLLLLLPAYFLWLARDFVISLAATRSVATAVVSTLHDGSDVQLQHAFAAAKTSGPAEATLEPQTNPSLRGTYYLSVTADTSERARADLATLTKALADAFPSAERNLSVSLNNSTVPAPSEMTRRTSIGVHAAIVLMILGCQLLLVIGSYYSEGQSRAGLFAALATPFIVLISAAPTRSPTTNTGVRIDEIADWKFVLLLLALTPVSVILALWLSRGSRRAIARSHNHL